MKVFGQLERAQAEVLSSDPAGVVNLAVGRVWFNKVDGYFKLSDEGNVVTKFLLNDDKIIIGTNGTANNNVRLNRGGAGILQVVLGGDATAEGSLSATPAILSSRQESYLQAGLPSFGHIGRLAFVTDQGVLKVDDGSAWRTILTSNGTTFDAQSLKIINGVDPTANQDLATKFYVDSNGSTNGPIPVTSKSANYTATISDQFIECDAGAGAFTITLYTAVGNTGKRIIIKKIDGFPNAVHLTGAQTIDAEATVHLYGINETIEVVSDGTVWKILRWYDQIKFFIANETQGNGTNGGTSSAGSQTRVLNTVALGAPWVSLSANQLTLQPGRYVIKASAPAYISDTHKAYLYNVTDAANAILGTSEQTTSGTAVQTRSFVSGTIVISTAKVYELRHAFSTGHVTSGLGVAASLGFSEVYAQIEIERINPRSS